MKKNFIHISYILTVSITILLTGCSSKNDNISAASDEEIEKFYEYSANAQIKNSKNMHRATMRPYVVNGEKYYPKLAQIGEEFRGIASWYGPDFHDKTTSNGETYDMYALTAAHKTLPMNTMVRVDNLENGKSVVVRINDRGPFVDGRIIDLSNTAARTIDMVRKGTANVNLTILGYNGKLENSQAPQVETIVQKPVTYTPVVNNYNVTNVVENTTNTYRGSYSLQVGSFSKLNGAKKVRYQYQKRFTNSNVNIKKAYSNGINVFRVLISGFNSQAQAKNFKYNNGLSGTVVVKN